MTRRRRVHAGGHLPLPRAKAVSMETKVLMAARALRGGFFNQGMGLDLSVFLTSFEHLPLSEAEVDEFLLPSMRAMASIADRHTRTGKWVPLGTSYRCSTAPFRGWCLSGWLFPGAFWLMPNFGPRRFTGECLTNPENLLICWLSTFAINCNAHGGANEYLKRFGVG